MFEDFLPYTHQKMPTLVTWNSFAMPLLFH